MAYATVQDVESRWRALTPSESERAAVLLSDASILLAPYDTENASEETLRMVACAMVRRAMTVDGDAFALGGPSESAGWAPNYPSGDLYITAAERRSLAPGARICGVPMSCF